MTSEDAIRSEHRRQAAAQVSVANVITSFRLCSTLDWSHYVESVSAAERVLQRDPAGAYANMDFLSRDRYRQAVEELAEPTGENQLRVALRAIASARTMVVVPTMPTSVAEPPSSWSIAATPRRERTSWTHSGADFPGTTSGGTSRISLGHRRASDPPGKPSALPFAIRECSAGAAGTCDDQKLA